MTLADVHRITLKERNCTATIEQDRNPCRYSGKAVITHNEKTTNSEISFVEIKLHSWQFIIMTMRSRPQST